MLNKNLFILSVGQIFSFTSPVVSVLLSGIIGSAMTDINYLATLPTALMIVGTAFGSLIASKIMKMKGRKFGFSLASIINSVFSLLYFIKMKKRLNQKLLNHKNQYLNYYRIKIYNYQF